MLNSGILNNKNVSFFFWSILYLKSWILFIVLHRFYFLSNDELLEILAQTRNPQAVQPHLRKCFDSIIKLEFALMMPAEGEQEKVFTNDILAMLSPEGERVSISFWSFRVFNKYMFSKYLEGKVKNTTVIDE